METLEQLSQELMPMHFGTDGYYGITKGDYVIMTSGMLDFVKKTDAIWLMQLLNSEEIATILKKENDANSMLVIKLTSENGTVKIGLEDGNYIKIWSKTVDQELLPGEFSFWLEPFKDNLVALLPSEH